MRKDGNEDDKKKKEKSATMSFSQRLNRKITEMTGASAVVDTLKSANDSAEATAEAAEAKRMGMTVEQMRKMKARGKK